MYAQTGKLIAQAGKGPLLADILLRAARLVGEIPGCRMYLIHEDIAVSDCIWVYEAWQDKAAHDQSLQDPRVRALIGEATPLIAAPPEGAELRVLGGHGLMLFNR